MAGIGFPVTRIGFPVTGSGSGPPSAPIISASGGAVTIGGTITITPGAGGGPVTGYRLYRDLIRGPVVTSPITETGAEVGASLTVRAYGPGGESIDSNVLQFVRPTTNLVVDLDGTHVTLTGGFISAALDQSGLGNDYGDIGAAGNRPAQSVGGGPNGIDAIDFTLRAGLAVGLKKADVGVGAAALTDYDVADVPASGRALCDGVTINTRLKSSQGTALALYSGAFAANPAALAGDAVVSAAVRNGASSKHAIDGGTAATGNPGASTSPGDTWGGVAGSANPAQCANAKAYRRMIYSVAHTDAQRQDIEQYLLWWWLNNPGSSRLFMGGDSIVKGYNGTSYNGGWRPAVAAALPTLKHVGTHYSHGFNNGTPNQKLGDVVSALSTFDAWLQKTMPSKIVLAWGVNDIGTGTAPATAIGYLQTIITQAQTSRPGVPIFVQNIIRPVGGLGGIYAAHDADAVTYNGLLAAAISGYAGVSLVIVPELTVTASDGIHPVDGATGYDLVAAPYETALA